MQKHKYPSRRANKKRKREDEKEKVKKHEKKEETEDQKRQKDAWKLELMLIPEEHIFNYSIHSDDKNTNLDDIKEIIKIGLFIPNAYRIGALLYYVQRDHQLKENLILSLDQYMLDKKPDDPFYKIVKNMVKMFRSMKCIIGRESIKSTITSEHNRLLTSTKTFQEVISSIEKWDVIHKIQQLWHEEHGRHMGKYLPQGTSFKTCLSDLLIGILERRELPFQLLLYPVFVTENYLLEIMAYFQIPGLFVYHLIIRWNSYVCKLGVVLNYYDIVVSFFNKRKEIIMDVIKCSPDIVRLIIIYTLY